MYRKSNKELNNLIGKKFVKSNKKRKTEKEISDNKSKKSISSLAESVESGEISSSSSKWKTGLDELFVTCLNRDSKN